MAKSEISPTGLDRVSIGDWNIQARKDGGIRIYGPMNASVETIYRGRKKYQGSQIVLVPGKSD